MSVPLTVNGAIFNYPVNFDVNWGIDATGWAQAVTAGMLQKSGGSFPLTAEVDFGASFGIKSLYFKSRIANPSTVGTLCLASADPGIGFRNAANNANLILTTDASDNLVWPSNLIIQNANSLKLLDSGSVHIISMKSPSTTATYTLTLPPNAGSADQVLRTDGSGTTTWVNAAGGGTVNSGTATHLAYYATTGAAVSAVPLVTTDVSGGDTRLTVTGQSGNSGILQLQADNGGKTNYLQTHETTGDWFLVNGDTSQIILHHSRATGTMIFGGIAGIDAGANKIISIAAPSALGDALTYGRTFDMGATKITGLANGTTATDAAAIGQVQYAFQNAVQGSGSSTSHITSTSYVSTVITATITPTSASSRIKIIAYIPSVSTTNSSSFVTLFRNSTDIATTNGFLNGNAIQGGPVTISFIDSPASTSSLTYTVMAKVTTGSMDINANLANWTIILEELR